MTVEVQHIPVQLNNCQVYLSSAISTGIGADPGITNVELAEWSRTGFPDHYNAADSKSVLFGGPGSNPGFHAIGRIFDGSIVDQHIMIIITMIIILTINLIVTSRTSPTS